VAGEAVRLCCDAGDEPRAANRVVIVEDRAMVAQALPAVLGAEPDIDVVAVVATGAEGLDALDRSGADPMLVDSGCRTRTGADVTGAVRQARPDVRVVVLTAAEATGVVARAISAGADGCLHKSDPRGVPRPPGGGLTR
jgi:two-component system response regulator DesR